MSAEARRTCCRRCRPCNRSDDSFHSREEYKSLSSESLGSARRRLLGQPVRISRWAWTPRAQCLVKRAEGSLYLLFMSGTLLATSYSAGRNAAVASISAANNSSLAATTPPADLRKLTLIAQPVELYAQGTLEGVLWTVKY